jgi:hypothetical protein
MAKTGKFIHNSAHLGLALGATNAYGAAARHNLDLNSDQLNVVGSTRGVASLSGLYVFVNTMAAGATALTVRLTRDLAGDIPVIPDTTATITTGVTTATTGSCVFKIDVDYSHSDDSLYCWIKTNAGTCTVYRLELTWEE